MANDEYLPFPTEIFEHQAEEYKGRQKQIDAADIELNCVAEVVAQKLFDAVIKFQDGLPDSDDVAIQLVKFNESITIFVNSIGYIGYNLIVFSGTDTSGTPMKLIQHVQQVNFLLTSVKRQEPSKRPIGFRAE